MSGEKKRAPPAKVATQKMYQELMREQVQLNQAQKDLKKLITTISEHINVLKVEELQLRANAVQVDIKPVIKPEFKPTTSSAAPCSFESSADVINKQNLDLDVFVSKIFNNLNEEDDDSDR